MSAEQTPRARRASPLVAVLVSTALTLLATELAGRFFLTGISGIAERPPSPSMLAIAFEPYLMFGFQYGWFEDADRASMEESEGPQAFGYRSAGPTYLFDFTEPVTAIDARGHFLFQDDGLADNPTAKALRVFVVGASVAQGVGSSSHETTWHVILERRLTQALGRDVHLIVGAVPGFVSTQERLALELMVLPRCPDAVIILNGWDDAALPGMLGNRPGDPINTGLLYEHYFPSTLDVGSFLVRHSALYRYLYHRRILAALEDNRAAIAGSEEKLASYRNSTASVYIDNMMRMLGSCERNSVPCAGFLQPSRALTDKGPSAEGWAIQESLERAAYEEIRARLPDLQQRYRVRDLSQVFEPGSDWFVDPVHFGDEGHAVIADAIYPVLEEMLRPIEREEGTKACKE